MTSIVAPNQEKDEGGRMKEESDSRPSAALLYSAFILPTWKPDVRRKHFRRRAFCRFSQSIPQAPFAAGHGVRAGKSLTGGSDLVEFDEGTEGAA